MRSVVLMVLLTGCGTDPSKNANASVADKTTPAASQDPDGAPAVPLGTVVDSEGVYAISLDNVKELPECSKANAKQLAYVKADSKFYSCESTGWAELTITAKGDKGDKGDVGPAGAVVVLPTNLWLDPVTNLTWLIGGRAPSTSTCTNGYRQGTVTELQVAISHGIEAQWGPGVNPDLVASTGEWILSTGLVDISNRVGVTAMETCLKNP